MNHKIYMDHNATTPMRKEVIQAMVELMEKEVPLNSSSIHSYGTAARAILEAARNKIMQNVGVDYHNRNYGLIFTSGGTEANNIAIQGMKEYIPITTTVEHVSILKVIGEGLITVDENGRIDLFLLDKLLFEISKQQKVLVSISLANNESGVIQSVREVSEICRKYGTLLHIDAVQALGKITVDFMNLGADMMTISSHKIGGPVGIGALIYNRTLNLRPIMLGGGQEYRLRPGTTSVLLAHGFAMACGLIGDSVMGINRYTLNLRDHMEGGLRQISEKVAIIGNGSARLPNTSLVYMPNVQNEIQVAHFDLYGVAVSAGSACSSGVISASHVVMGMGYDEKIARSTIRISLGLSSVRDDIVKFLELWKELYSRCNNDDV